MLVQECMTRTVVTASPATSVLAARRLLTLYRIRHLPVVEGGAVVGIVSDRDIRLNDRDLTSSLGSLQSDLLMGRYRRLAAVMTAPVHTIRPTVKLHIAALFMVSRHIGALPVVDEGRLVGIISLTDCVWALAREDRKHRAAAPRQRDIGWQMPMPPGDPRPGRPQRRRSAVVVDPDPAARTEARKDLEVAGYDAVTCPGPAGGAYCPSLRDVNPSRCARVPSDTELVLLKSDENALALAEAYARWLPNATIRQTSP